MASFAGMRHALASYVSPYKPSTADRLLSPPDSDLSREQELKGTIFGPESSDLDHNLDGNTLVDSTSQSRNRSLPPKASPAATRKRAKDHEHGYTPEDEFDSDFEGVTLETSTPPPTRKRAKLSPTKNATDRALMPPPASPANLIRKPNSRKSQLVTRLPDSKESFTIPSDHEEGFSDDETFTSRTAIRKNGHKEVVNYDEQKALRYAEAMTLPDTGADWAEAEKDLFFRLAFRGFEPLLPRNWTTDFPTLPSNLFSIDGGASPLVESHLQREFRAIHALRELFSMGMIVRNRVLSRHLLRPEPVIRSSLHKYLSWAFLDMGLHPEQRPNAIPVHAFASMKKGQTTQSTITAISDKLHALADRYRNAYSIRDSIEPGDSASVTSDGSSHEGSRLPVLTGLMICSSLIVIVTLNSAALMASRGKLSPNRRGSLQAAKDESGLRFIATIDFSKEDMDVWNSLAIAICVMRIRKTMAELCERGEANGENAKGGLWERTVVTGSRGKTDDPDL